MSQLTASPPMSPSGELYVSPVFILQSSLRHHPPADIPTQRPGVQHAVSQHQHQLCLLTSGVLLSLHTMLVPRTTPAAWACAPLRPIALLIAAACTLPPPVLCTCRPALFLG